MKHIIRRYQIIIKDSGDFQPEIYLLLGQVQNLPKFAYAICYKFQSFIIHELCKLGFPIRIDCKYSINLSLPSNLKLWKLDFPVYILFICDTFPFLHLPLWQIFANFDMNLILKQYQSFIII